MKETLDVWYNSLDKVPVEKNEKDEIRKRIWSGIIEGRDDTIQPDLPARPVRGWIWKTAILLAFSGATLYFSDIWPSRPETADEAPFMTGTNWIEEINSTNMTRDIFLPDGSRVMLGPGSKLRHPKYFENDSRTIYMEGSGFFDVTKDPERPFLVYSGAVLTRVLGTSFSIKSIAETGGTEVAVVTGKVMVEKSSFKKNSNIQNETRVVLTPNKKVTFFNNSDHYVTGLVENPLMVQGQEEYLKPGVFDFDETPLREVLGKLEKAYGVEITLSDDKMLECPVTADVSSENLYGKMEIIGAVLNAKYEITGSSILLSGGGCGPSNPNPKP